MICFDWFLCTLASSPPPLPPSLQHHKYFSSGRLTAAGPALDLADVGREDEGVYVCVADNQVSRPVTESIALNVLCESPNTTRKFKMIFLCLGSFAFMQPHNQWKKNIFPDGVR